MNQELPGSRAGGLHARTIEVFDERGVAELFLSQGQIMQVTGFSFIPLDISGFPTRHNDGLALRQARLECKQAGIEFPGWDASTSFLIAEVEMTEEPARGIRRGRTCMPPRADRDSTSACRTP